MVMHQWKHQTGVQLPITFSEKTILTAIVFNYTLFLAEISHYFCIC